ncbi:YraN family protein [Microbacterium karelineae]|uniref:YraN family protein n=1 Tax=Microbacterium karelineae TaxID=2654283 RepID=UPI0012EADA41|nr:YraN family protein [Microbacterium karelineae]
MPHNTTLGRAGEQRAARHLADAGYDVVDRNWRCSDGELDLVAVRRDVLVIVEVKTRTSRRYGHPLEALDARKTDRLWRLAFMWARAHPDLGRGRRVRVDAIAVTGPDPETAEVEHLRGLR